MMLTQLRVTSGAIIFEQQPIGAPARQGPIRELWVDEETTLMHFLTREEAAELDPRWAPAIEADAEEEPAELDRSRALIPRRT